LLAPKYQSYSFWESAVKKDAVKKERPAELQQAEQKTNWVRG
jgi:hypothetical protein